MKIYLVIDRTSYNNDVLAFQTEEAAKSAFKRILDWLVSEDDMGDDWQDDYGNSYEDCLSDCSINHATGSCYVTETELIGEEN